MSAAPYIARALRSAVPLALLAALCGHAAPPLPGQVDVFPAQHASTLHGSVSGGGVGEAVPSAVPAPPPPASSASQADAPPPSVPSAPFEFAGEWIEAGRHVIVLNGNARVVLVCRRCDVPGAVRPGQALPGAPDYRVGAIARGRVVLRGPGGREHVLRLDGAAS